MMYISLKNLPEEMVLQVFTNNQQLAETYDVFCDKIIEIPTPECIKINFLGDKYSFFPNEKIKKFEKFAPIKNNDTIQITGKEFYLDSIFYSRNTKQLKNKEDLFYTAGSNAAVTPEDNSYLRLAILETICEQITYSLLTKTKDKEQKQKERIELLFAQNNFENIIIELAPGYKREFSKIEHLTQFKQIFHFVRQARNEYLHQIIIKNSKLPKRINKLSQDLLHNDAVYLQSIQKICLELLEMNIDEKDYFIKFNWLLENIYIILLGKFYERTKCIEAEKEINNERIKRLGHI